MVHYRFLIHEICAFLSFCLIVWLGAAHRFVGRADTEIHLIFQGKYDCSISRRKVLFSKPYHFSPLSSGSLKQPIPMVVNTSRRAARRQCGRRIATKAPARARGSGWTRIATSHSNGDSASPRLTTDARRATTARRWCTAALPPRASGRRRPYWRTPRRYFRSGRGRATSKSQRKS